MWLTWRPPTPGPHIPPTPPASTRCAPGQRAATRWAEHAGSKRQYQCGRRSGSGHRRPAALCLQALRDHNVKVVTVSPGNLEGTGMASEKGERARGWLRDVDCAACATSPERLAPAARSQMLLSQPLRLATKRRCCFHCCYAAGRQGAVAPSDVAEAILFVFRVSPNCVPEEITIKAVQPAAGRG